jgi:hypothetical protein
LAVVSLFAGVFLALTFGVCLPTDACTLAGDYAFCLWGDAFGDSVFLAADLPLAGVYVLDFTYFLADFGSGSNNSYSGSYSSYSYSCTSSFTGVYSYTGTSSSC